MSKIFIKYNIQFFIRVSIFVIVLCLYIFKNDFLYSFMTHEFGFRVMKRGITLLHILWGIFMLTMLSHLIPVGLKSLALRKNRKEEYSACSYSKIELLEFVQDMNIKAWRVLAVWLVGNGFVGLLYLFNILDDADLLMLTVFYYLSDYICILFFCPFQKCIMKNKCCINCRIFDWGHFMMFTPMLFIRNFFSWSLFFTSCLVLIHWEIVYAKHPERFYFNSNDRLKCENCTERLCMYKNKLKTNPNAKEVLSEGNIK